ncbi:glycosyltransferase family 4 protein [Rhizobium hidalgonense]|uniref:Glycosyltransferase family 4 protein n=1 Tax=Rhizobium hidalgonense TaxID=1538159 RepID=A0AAJ2GXX4_9HYPH|nr:glycosyltransferase family 4 protein [Rhizobium hidalgonense]MDR9775990.1 glycosyltransferase family 4 protein [Rhizobium hidalgonense]MDR9814119.1 glycosyltransferase family 4 protein [Rhizobium hidalgonense]MDR9820797.1 glycosyltransferase family 4 protein [Rhizobium hidalgonense]
MTGRGRSNRRRVVMTVDAVGGVWRYAMDLASALKPSGIEVVFAGLGPVPAEEKIAEANRLGTLVWLDAPLDWMEQDEKAVAGVPRLIADLARREAADLLHLNLPSQAAGIETDLPVIVVCHSCVVTWFAAVRSSDVPRDWQWQYRLNSAGFARADSVIAPSGSHAAAMELAYGPIPNLNIVYNSSALDPSNQPKLDIVLAAGRWWDEGKNGAALDTAAKVTRWPVVAAGANYGPKGQYLQFRHADHRGELSHERMMALARQAAIVASPSIYEPFGLAALEAARAGAALVLSDIPTYREIWEDAALFADPHQPKAFADAFNRLAGDPQQRIALGLKAQERSARFSRQAQAAAMCRIYSGTPGHVSSTAAE